MTEDDHGAPTTNGSNGTTAVALSEPDATVQVVLSRPAYRLGGSVVGTIRLVVGNPNRNEPRDVFTSAQVYVAGRCKVDDRWHNPEIYKKLYGTHPHLKECIDVERKACSAEDTVCFWATNIVDLLDLQERTVGEWEDVNPKMLVENSGLLHDCEIYDDAAAEYDGEQDLPLEDRHLAFTFRVDLPLDIPHSASAMCVRYSYSAVVSVRTSSNELLVVNAPFSVLTPLAGNALSESDLATAPRVRLGTCSAMAHSAGLPSHVTATDLNHPKGATTVNRNANLLATVASGNVQTLRIADPDGEPCCILTALGSQSMNPGSHLLLQFDFPSSWVPCHQVSACLQGEEIALYEDGSTNKTRTLLLDTAYELVEPGYTERVSLSLHLPLDCPCTVLTDLVKISVQCRIDLACEKADGGYSNLQFHLPIKVAHSPTADESNGNEYEYEDVNETPLDEIVFGAEALSLVEKDSTKPTSFVTRDIRKDLKVLSLQMVEACDLKT